MIFRFTVDSVLEIHVKKILSHDINILLQRRHLKYFTHNTRLTNNTLNDFCDDVLMHL